MQGNVFDVALLSVLMLFFGILQAHRSQREYRMWLCAWVLVMCSYLTYQAHIADAFRTLKECIRIDFLVCGGLVFLLSFVPRKPSVVRVSLLIALLSIAPCLLLNLMTAGVNHAWLSAALIISGEAIGIWVALQLLGSSTQGRLIQGLCCAAGSSLLAAVWYGYPDVALTVTLAQIFSACALLLLSSPRRGRVGTWAMIVGFMAWALLYFVYEASWVWPALSPVLEHTWHLPKYLVGLGMILTVVENDTASMTALSEEYRLLYENNPVPMWIFSPSTSRFLSVNDAALKVYGYTREEFLMMTLFDIRTVEERPRLERELRNLTSEKQVWQHSRKNGEVFDVEISSHDVLFGGSPARFVMAKDITEQEKVNRDLVYRAQHDGLTGLANRVLLEERANQTLARSARDRTKAAILTIDVDRFKRINDTYGHLVGDECLRGIATRLASRVREADTLARTGGEEFTVLVGGLSSVQGAYAAAATLLGTLAKPLTLSTNEIAISVSIGIAVYPDDGEDLETIRNCSDKALYQAKRLGGGRAVLATQEQSIERQSAVDIEAALRSALEDSHLELAYQPIFDSAGHLARVEALVRGTAECLRKAGPGGFIPIAEESGLIVPLGRWVIEESCRQMAIWRARNLPPFALSVNVSARQLVQSDFPEHVLRALALYDIPAELLHLELTETTLMHDFSTMVRAMRRLSEAGVLFSIDDFGTGYSSLARLSELPISTLKIDRSFVVKLLEGEASVGIVSAIVQMSRHLKLAIVAEGVELPEHIQLLRELGCDMFQGYYLSPPLDAGALERAIVSGELGSPQDFPLHYRHAFGQGETLRLQ